MPSEKSITKTPQWSKINHLRLSQLSEELYNLGTRHLVIKWDYSHFIAWKMTHIYMCRPLAIDYQAMLAIEYHPSPDSQNRKPQYLCLCRPQTFVSKCPKCLRGLRFFQALHLERIWECLSRGRWQSRHPHFYHHIGC